MIVSREAKNVGSKISVRIVPAFVFQKLDTVGRFYIALFIVRGLTCLYAFGQRIIHLALDLNRTVLKALHISLCSFLSHAERRHQG